MRLLAFLAVGLFGLTVVSAAVVKVDGYGTLNGTEGHSSNTNRRFYTFRGVYYGEKPNATQRFLPPIPKAPYPPDVIVDATTYNLGCLQEGLTGIGSEDCLSLSIHTPKLPTGTNDTLLPVMYWIHGGSFKLGQAIEYSPTRFMEQDIVLVAVQYRLGPLGFLCFDTDEVPGNAGIFDQIEGLRWVQKHIKAFGGDPNQVTIAGESAGSASVSLLLLAPQAKGLFHRAIGESGSVLAPWAVNREGLTPSKRVAELAGCALEPYDSLLNCLRTIEGVILNMAYNKYAEEENLKGGLGFGASSPVIQKAGAQKILEVDPRLLFESGNYSKVPLMMGANKREGALVLASLYNNFLKPNNLLENRTFLANEMVPSLLKSLGVRDDDGSLAQEYTKKYLGTAEMGNFTSMTPGLVDLASVLFVKNDSYEALRLNSKYVKNSYWYSFDFEGNKSLYFYYFALSWPPIPHQVDHADELIYLYVYPFLTVLNVTELELSNKMIQVWTNFVIYGDPTPDGLHLLPGIPKFPTYDSSNLKYMAIDANWQVKVDYTKTYTVNTDGGKASVNFDKGRMAQRPQ